MKNPFNNHLYLTDGGLETTLVFDRQLTLRHFAAFELLNSEDGRKELRDYYCPYLTLAAENELPFVLDTPTWRANPDWGFKLGYTSDELKAINRSAVEFIRDLARTHTIIQPVISGCVGPRGDGYVPGYQMTAEESSLYHESQIRSFALADADIISAYTLNYVSEAIGIIQAASQFKIPVVISFTLETDGRLPDGTLLADAIKKADDETQGYCLHYMINCAHPSHFIQLFEKPAEWQSRIRGIRANASAKSHEELDASEQLDKGDACALGKSYKMLYEKLPWIKVIGGCCGTDHSHIKEMMNHLPVHAG
jgi:S-methylmethionine-dependent homocysteine/selenocysteine methylase